MNTRIIAMYPCKGKFCTVEIFGYSTRGLPGLEIVGLGGSGRQLKEKLIYITRLQKVGLPLNRYVLCVEKKGRIVARIRCGWSCLF